MPRGASFASANEEAPFEAFVLGELAWLRAALDALLVVSGVDSEALVQPPGVAEHLKKQRSAKGAKGTLTAAALLGPRLASSE